MVHSHLHLKTPMASKCHGSLSASRLRETPLHDTNYRPAANFCHLPKWPGRSTRVIHEISYKKPSRPEHGRNSHQSSSAPLTE
eukprot:10116_5